MIPISDHMFSILLIDPCAFRSGYAALTVPDLRRELLNRGEATTGKKAALVARLEKLDSEKPKGTV